MFKQLRRQLFKRKSKEVQKAETQTAWSTTFMESIKNAKTIEIEKMTKQEQEDYCRECKGKCCKVCGCHFSPSDFEEISYQYLKNEIEKGYISISYAMEEVAYRHASSGLFFLRVRNKGACIVDCGYWPMEHDGCIIQTDKGCKFSSKERPKGGLELNPERGGVFVLEIKCQSEYGIYKCTGDWLEHQDILKELIKHFEGYSISYPCKL